MLNIKDTNIGDVLTNIKKERSCFVVVGYDEKNIHLASIFYVEKGWNDVVAMYGSGLKVDGMYLGSIDDSGNLPDYKIVGNIYMWRDIMSQVSEHVIEPRRFCKKCLHRKCKYCSIMIAIERERENK